MKTIADFLERLVPAARLTVVFHRQRLLGRGRYGNPRFIDTPPLRRMVKQRYGGHLGRVEFLVVDPLALRGSYSTLYIPKRRDVEFNGDDSVTIYCKVREFGPKGETMVRRPLATYTFLPT